MKYKYSVRPIIFISGMLLGLSWLLPNHTEPWKAYHSETLSAVAVTLIAIFLAPMVRLSDGFTALTKVALILVPVPMIQFWIGIVPFFGQAWIVSVYLYAVFVALLVGEAWGRENFHQLGNYLFSAITFAASISVTLQLQQWLEVGRDGTLNVWVVDSVGGRPAANLAQPNHLATLLLWGVIATWWWKSRAAFGNFTASLISVFFLFGVALTQSRTGGLGVLAIMIATSMWRPLRGLWGSPKAAYAYSFGMTFFYIVFFWSVQKIASVLLIAAPGSIEDRMTSEARPVIWRILIDAVKDRPLLGYGWNSVVPAQLSQSEKYPSLQVAFFQSHNLFLDFFVWMGVPLGLGLTIFSIAWLVKLVSKIDSLPKAIGFLQLVVVGIHAMFEYPLYYLYFLLPAALMIGALDSKEEKKITLGLKSTVGASRTGPIVLVAAGGLLIALISWDYFRAESSYQSFNLEEAGLRERGHVGRPKILVLNQLDEELNSKYFKPRVKMSNLEIFRAERVLELSPSAKNFLNLSLVYGLNDKPQNAALTLVRMCKMIPVSQCKSAKRKWDELRGLYVEIREVRWPDEK